MKTYRITITLPGGAKSCTLGIFSSACAAIVAVLDAFPQATRISARRLP